MNPEYVLACILVVCALATGGTLALASNTHGRSARVLWFAVGVGGCSLAAQVGLLVCGP
jgi:hypothetical protein